jgi:hypothetical protein
MRCANSTAEIFGDRFDQIIYVVTHRSFSPVRCTCAFFHDGSGQLVRRVTYQV